MKAVFAIARLAAASAIVIAIAFKFIHTSSFGPINPFNFFGLFTVQNSVIAAVAFGASAIFILRNADQPKWVIYLRAFAAVLMPVVGIVYVIYDTYFTTIDLGAYSLPWSNAILHVWIPVYAALDWAVFGDRDALPYSTLWYVLVYPALWLIVVLVRGATDGWVPYPFLSLANGYASVAIYALAITVFTLLLAVGVYALSRVKALKP